jgi:quercetin dioxygenase-like cupin family protein
MAESQEKALDKPYARGRADRFTGVVRIHPLGGSLDPATVNRASVTFEAGARTAWHSAPLGQTLIVTAGCGWVKHEDAPVEEVRSGDAVRFAPGEKHWLGATAKTEVTFVALQEELDGRTIDWMEKVTDDQYQA